MTAASEPPKGPEDLKAPPHRRGKATIPAGVLPVVYIVTGTVSSADSAAVGGLSVQLVDKNVGSDKVLGQAITDSFGKFTIDARVSPSSLKSRRKTSPDLQVHVLQGKQVVASSIVRYNAGGSEELDVVLPAGTLLPSEFETLTRALTGAYAGPLEDLREDDQRQDITYLANKSGWDARAVAMTSLAAQLSADSAKASPRAGNDKRRTGASARRVGVPSPFYYALLRAGVPADPAVLYRTSTAVVESAWHQAIANGIIPEALADEVPVALERFTSVAAAQALAAPATVGPSTLGDLLSGPLGDDAARQQEFATLLVQHADSPDELWSNAEKAFGAQTVASLQLAGQLAYLTINNAPLVDALHTAAGDRPIVAPLDLATRGYGSASTWTSLLADVQLPAEIAGTSLDEQRANYAELLAAQVRLGFPTATVGQLVESGELPLADPALQNEVAGFLTDNQENFDIGAEPVARYAARTGTKADSPVVAEVARLQRVYQITPNHDAMTTLAAAGIDSALAAVQLGREQFVANFSDALGGSDVATFVYARARAVYASTLNATLGYLNARRAPSLGSGVMGTIVDPLQNWSNLGDGNDNGAAPVFAQATLDDLFNNLDYCACEDCRSVIGPAAYLVDLLHYIDVPATPPHGNPQQILLTRRPDIGALTLTCDNTNIALPYVDLVNETLEYYVGNHLSTAGYEGHDTNGDVTSSAELVATPQNDDDTVAQTAYDALKGAWYPAPLPFHRDLERLRQRLATLGTTLYDVMRVTRTTDDLEAPAPTPSNPAPYGMRDVLAERLGISRLEYRLLTDSTLSLDDVFGYPPGTDVIAAMSSLQEFSRRTDVVYADVVRILETSFVNPACALIPLLEDLAVRADVLVQLHDGTITAAQFAAELPAGIDPARYGAVDLVGIASWVTANYAAIMQLIVVDVTGPPSDTTQMTLRRLDPSPGASALQPIDLVRLLRLIRLWHRLGVTIEQTDALLAALYAPAGAGSDLQQLDAGMSKALPLIGLLYELVDLLGLDLDADLANVLALWTPISTTGSDSLYARLFLNPAAAPVPAGQTNVFTPAQDGTVLSSAPAPFLLDHKSELCAAVNLTGSEFDLIVGSQVTAGLSLGLGYDASTPLNIQTISAIYRRAWLARVLQLSVLELLSLRACSEIDPFATPVVDAIHPVSSPAHEFVQLVQDLNAGNLTPLEALYLLWNVDLSGVSQPAASVVINLAATLRSAFVAVDNQFAVTPAMSMNTARNLISLVLGPAETDAYIGLLDQTNVTSIPFSYTSAELPAAVVTASGGKLAYDDLAKQLSFTGYLPATILAAMHTAATGDAALDPAITALATAAAASLEAFFATYDDSQLHLSALFTQYVGSDPTLHGNVQALLGELLPALANRRKQQQALAAVTAAVGCDPAFAPALLDQGGAIPAAASPASPGVDDLTALAQGGLTVSFFYGNDPTAPPSETPATAASPAYGPDNPLRPAGDPGVAPFAATWVGYLYADQNANYNLRIAVDAGATVDVAIDGHAVLGGIGAGNVWSNTQPIPLTAGQLARIEITARGLSNTFSASWETTGTGWQTPPPNSLVARSLVDDLRTTYLRFLKATALASDLSLSADELTHLATEEGLTVAGGGWLATLTVDAQAPPATYPELAKVTRTVLDFVLLEAKFAHATITLLDAIDGIRAGNTSKLIALTGWDAASLDAVLRRLLGTPAFPNPPALLGALRRLDDAFGTATTCRLAAGTLIQAATNDPSDDLVRTIEAAMRSRYAEADWLAAVKPGNDRLRTMQRDALVAFVLINRGDAILAELGIASTPNRIPTADDLFNYFLMDVEMQPCMETSRVRHALSSVQLFIERSLRNLEPSVDPGGLDARQWEWRKRFRVWQANREVFLWPENWLDPSLRDDQSTIFKTTLTELLQSDITDDTAAAAYLDYLSKLELVAKLEPCALYYEPATGGGGNDVAHVVARTSGAHRKYYYRRYQGGAWTPWDEIKLQIEDNPIAIYVWNSRVILLWLQIHQKPSVDSSNIASNLPPTSSTDQLASVKLGDLNKTVAASATKQTAMQTSAMLCFSEYYNGHWQSPKTSDVSDTVDVTSLARPPLGRAGISIRPWRNVDPSDEALYVELTSATDRPWINTGGVIIYLGPHYQWATGFVLHNTHSAPVSMADVDPVRLRVASKTRSLPPISTADGRTLQADYQSLVFSLFGPQYDSPDQVTVLGGHLPERSIAAHPLDIDQWTMPFFFEDARNAFYVTTSARLITFDHFTGFGLDTQGTAAIKDVKIPPLVFVPAPVQPGDPAELIPQLGDPAEAQRALATAGGMKAVIGATASIPFNGRNIGAISSTPRQSMQIDAARAEEEAEQ